MEVTSGGRTVGDARMLRRPRARVVAAGLAVLQLFAACQVYVPPRTQPTTGASMQFQLSDEGRVTHASRIGPGIRQLTGALRRMEGERYVIDVASVTPIRGPRLPVSGIEVALGPRDLTDARVRTVSRKRTGLLIGGALALIVTFFVTEGFSAGHTPAEGPEGPGGPDQSRGSRAVTCCH